MPGRRCALVLLVVRRNSSDALAIRALVLIRASHSDRVAALTAAPFVAACADQPSVNMLEGARLSARASHTLRNPSQFPTPPVSIQTRRSIPFRPPFPEWSSIGSRRFPDEVVMNVRKRLALVVWVFLLFALAPLATAQPSFGTNDEFRAIPTFHSLSVYWNPSNKSTARFAQVEYKPQGAPDSAYKRGLDLWYDSRVPPRPGGGIAGEYRGSLVHLQAETAYDLRLRLREGETGPVVDEHLVPAQTTCTPGTGQLPPESCTRTWSETFSGTTIDINTLLPANGYRRLWLRGSDGHSGTPSNWKIYTAPEGSNTIDQEDFPNGDGTGGGVQPWHTDSCINLEGVSYVVIRGLNLRNCATNAIYLSGGSHHVVIEGNDISGWGRMDPDAGQTHLPEGNAAVFCQDPSEANKVSTIVVQTNTIYDPRHGSSPWWTTSRGHPEGALAVRFRRCGSNHVIRYNDVFASEGHYFKDGFGGDANFGGTNGQGDEAGQPDQGGFPWADSDIYGNRIQNIYDDAIETEGDARNVRVWANYIDQVFNVIGNATVGAGPLYVWRNVSHSLGGMSKVPQCRDANNKVFPCPAGTPQALPDDESRAKFIKGGGETQGYAGGRAYYLHNTILQPPAAYCGGTSLPCGAGTAIENVEAFHYNVISHNNLWQIHKPARDPDGFNFGAISGLNCDLGSAANQTACRFSHDMYNNGPVTGVTRTTPPDWSNVSPQYATSGGIYPGSAWIPSAGNGWQGDFTLQAETTGHGDALVLFNFNDQFVSPDVGAHQSGTGTMKFGRAAAGQSGPGGGGDPGPTAALDTTPSPADIAANESVTFNSSSTPGNSTFTSITLDFGDGSPVVDWLPDHPTPKPHTYTVPRATPYTATLTVTTADGRSDHAPVTVAVSCGANAPSAILGASSPTSGPTPLEVTFTVQSSAVSPATIDSYSIDYGDGTSGTDLVHTYTTAAQRTATLIVTDSNDCKSAASTQLISVTGAPGGVEPITVLLQDGVGGYVGATDTKIASEFASSNFGASGSLDLRMETSVSVLARFAIFASEGGPVPNNATITSATLSFYKHSGAEATMKVSRLLKNWTESGATWQTTGAGANWTTAGARGAGSDYLATPDDQALISSATGCAGQDGGSQCWINFNVTAGVQAFRNGTPNYGWKLAYVSGPLEPPKWIYSGDNAGWPTLRPKLAITYTVPTGNTVTLRHELNGYAGATDTKIASLFSSSNFGTEPNLDLRMESSVSVLSRFAIFASEGGPVPDNATITLATLSFYKYSGAEATMKVSRLLKNWTESGATWLVTGAGANWTTAGARGAGSDYLATPDAQASVGSGTGCSGQDGGPTCWINFNVTAGVQAFKDGTANYGWKLAYVNGPLDPPKWINARENENWPTLRPKLLIEYTP
jgi:hypothetical protein